MEVTRTVAAALQQSSAEASRRPGPGVIRKNDNGGADPLPEHRQKTVEAGLATYQKVLAERDELERQLHEANLKLEAMTVQLDSLKSVVNMMESTYLSTKLEMENRVMQHQTQRDEAVSRTAALETTLQNVVVVIRNAMTEPE